MTATREHLSSEIVVDLVRRAGEGDRRAWEALVDEYVGLIWAVTRSFGLREADAGDVVQTTWLRLLEHITRLNDPARVGAWLATTARRECLRVLAQGKRTTLSGDDALLDLADITLPDMEARLVQADDAAQIQAAMQVLPPRWRELLTMLMADPSPSYEEISRRLNVPIGSIGPTRGRALNRLRSVLGSDVSLIPASASC
jgi:RNA polymerase sigma factor (sigma-70 family)